MIIFISILQLHDNLYSQLPCHHVQVPQVPPLHMFSSVPVLAPTSPPSLAPACTPGTHSTPWHPYCILGPRLSFSWPADTPWLYCPHTSGVHCSCQLSCPGSCRLYQRCLESPGPGRGCVRRGAGRSGATPASTDIIKVKHSDPLTFLRLSQCPGKYW